MQKVNAIQYRLMKDRAEQEGRAFDGSGYRVVEPLFGIILEDDIYRGGCAYLQENSHSAFTLGQWVNEDVSAHLLACETEAAAQVIIDYFKGAGVTGMKIQRCGCDAERVKIIEDEAGARQLLRGYFGE